MLYSKWPGASVLLGYLHTVKMCSQYSVEQQVKEHVEHENTVQCVIALFVRGLFFLFLF